MTDAIPSRRLRRHGVERQFRTAGKHCDMKLELLTLCDFAKGESSGKLYIIGAFDHIYATQEPVTAPMCAIAARIRFEAAERGQKQVTISFVDSDGGRVIPDVTMQMS